MNTLLDNLYARRPKIHYVCPPICGCEVFTSGSGSSAVSFEPGDELKCVNYFLTNRGLEWLSYPGAACYNVYQSADSHSYVPIVECGPLQTLSAAVGSCYVVTAITSRGETPFCAPVCPGVTPVEPEPPGPPPALACVDYFLTNTTAFTSDFTWLPYPDATGYNVFSAPTSDPLNFSLTHANVGLSVLPIVCQRIQVTALTPRGETPRCDPITFCNTVSGACGPITTDVASLHPAAWWKADSYGTLPDGTLLGGPGLEWIDQSGNGRHATVGIAPPQYRAVSAGFFPGSGLPSVDCSNAGGWFVFPQLAIGLGDFTYMFLYSGNPGYPLNVFAQGNPGAVLWAVHGNYRMDNALCATLHSPVDACADGGNFSGNPVVATFRRAGGVLSFWANSTFLASVAAPCNYDPITQLGSGLVGEFGEVFLFDKALSDGNIAAIVEGYLRPKWCLTDCVA